MNQFLVGNFIFCFEPVTTLDLDHVTVSIQSQRSWAYLKQKRTYAMFFVRYTKNVCLHNKCIKWRTLEIQIFFFPNKFWYRKNLTWSKGKYRGADKSFARSRRKQARKHVRDARDFNNIGARADIKFLFLQGKASKEIRDILTETLACFLPGRAKDLSAPL